MKQGDRTEIFATGAFHRLWGGDGSDSGQVGHCRV